MDVSEETALPQRQKRNERRRRALRAARTVTLGVTMALPAAGCSESLPRTGMDLGTTDALQVDMGVPDLGRPDSGIDCSGNAHNTIPECCDRIGGMRLPSGGCAIVGPFTPPNVPA